MTPHKLKSMLQNQDRHQPLHSPNCDAHTSPETIIPKAPAHAHTNPDDNKNTQPTTLTAPNCKNITPPNDTMEAVEERYTIVQGPTKRMLTQPRP